MEKKQLAKQIRNSDTWNQDLLEELCSLAGLEKEWEQSDGDNFEKVAFKAADILEVEII